MKQPLRIVISGGGTGGHIFPAIAIADAVKRLRPDAEILFTGAKNRMEMSRVPAAGYSIKGLWISGFQRKLSLQNILFPLKVIVSYFDARSILRKFKPDCVIGVGGYASGPTLRAAISLKIKTLIQEQNSYPGVTNRILAGKADRICVAYEAMEKWFPISKTVLTGNPLRKSAVDTAGKRDEALKFFGLKASGKVLLIVGGSQGARAINHGIAAMIESYRDSGIQLVWQTGEAYFPEAIALVDKAGAGETIKPLAFIQRMDLAYAAADCLISRAGAIAISEISVVGKPVIFVPLPTAAEDHQTSNARRLVDKNAAVLVHNNDTAKPLFDEVMKLMQDQKRMEQLSESIRKFALPEADVLIAQEIIKLTGK
jgi:UDP-N-acetylglucosamine--N-acetylmuramyl-(pentapeptide) pyrophosphoryl-undecaprenol N-acetylglucosamine transferase